MTVLRVKEFEDLVEMKMYYMDEVDAACGEARLDGVTYVPYQQTIYIDKLEEAKQILKQGQNYNPDDSVWLAGEAEDAGQTLLAYAQLVYTKNREWMQRTAAIDRIRLEAKIQIRSMSSPLAMYDVLLKVRDDLGNLDSVGEML